MHQSFQSIQSVSYPAENRMKPELFPSKFTHVKNHQKLQAKPIFIYAKLKFEELNFSRYFLFQPRENILIK